MGNKKRKSHIQTEITSVFLPSSESKEMPWRKRLAQIRIEIAEGSGDEKHVIRLETSGALNSFNYDRISGRMAKILESIRKR